MTPAGFPHSDIPGSKTVCVSPRLFAAYHVLHRLLAPRHPPCTLSSLTGFSKVLLLCLPSVSYSVVNERCATLSSRGAARSGSRRSRYRRTDPASLDSGGDSGARTRSLRLAKPALSQLSYIPVRTGGRVAAPGRSWWAWVDSNHPPHAYQACALTN
jgi:hypothetical protein